MNPFKFEDLDVWEQSQLIAYSQVREYEDLEQSTAMVGAMIGKGT